MPIVAVCYVWLIMFDPANGVLNQALMALGMDHPINWLNDPRTALFSIVLVLSFVLCVQVSFLLP